MSSSDSSGVRTWGPQNGGYNLDSMSNAPHWSPSPRPSSSCSPAFEQQRYGPSSRQPYGRGNQYGGSTGRPKSGSTSAIRITVTATQPSNENSFASRTIVKQRGSANQHPGERRSANQHSREDKVQAMVTQTVVKRRGSANLHPRKRRSTDQYPNVEERSPEIRATPVPVG